MDQAKIVNYRFQNVRFDVDFCPQKFSLGTVIARKVLEILLAERLEEVQ